MPQADIVRSTLSRGSDGWRHSVVYYIESAATLKAAVDQTVAYNTESGEIPGIYALEFSAEHAEEQPTQYWVTVVYRRPDPFNTDDNPPDPTPSGGTIQVGSRLQPATFTQDVNGTQITTQHTYAEPAPGRNGLEIQAAEVEGFTPTTVLTVSRPENGDPLSKSQTYVGTLNSSTFFSQPAKSWLCTAIEGISEDNGATYSVTYEFEYNREGWEAAVAFIDDKTNRPVSPLVAGVSLETYQLYDTANFGVLNL